MDVRNYRAAILSGLMALAGSTAAWALDVDPGDYTALPPGTNAFLLYGQYGQRNTINVIGGGDIDHGYRLDSGTGVARFVHFMDIGGITVDPQVLIPFGSLYNGKLSGRSAPASSGFGNPILAATAWLINKPDPDYQTFLGITPFVMLPFGQFDGAAPLNLGSNAVSGVIQVGYSQGIAPQWVFELYADAQFYGNSHGNGALRQTLAQDPSYEVQAFLSYRIAPTVTLSLAHASTFGGDQYLGGIRNGLRTEVQQVRGIVQVMLDERTQIQAAIAHDYDVRGGQPQDFGVHLRVLKILP